MRNIHHQHRLFRYNQLQYIDIGRGGGARGEENFTLSLVRKVFPSSFVLLNSEMTTLSGSIFCLKRTAE